MWSAAILPLLFFRTKQNYGWEYQTGLTFGLQIIL